MQAVEGICCKYMSRLPSGILMHKLSLRPESCKHSWMWWGALAINSRKGSGFKGFYRKTKPHTGYKLMQSRCFLTFSLFLSFSVIFFTLSSHLPAFMVTISLKNKQNFLLPCLCCVCHSTVVRGLLFLQVGDGLVLQMDMSCGAMPSQLHKKEPRGLEQSSQAVTEKEGNYLWPGEPGCCMGQAGKHGEREKEMERGQKGSRVAEW